MTFTQLINDFPRLLAYTLCLIALIQLFVIFFVQRKDIVIGLKGKDLMWQFLELSGIAWLVLFPIVIFCSLLGVEVDSLVWASMDAIYFMNLGGKMGNKWIDAKNGTIDKPKPDQS